MCITYTEHVKPGKKLPNGARVIACRAKDDDTLVVLAMWLRGRNDVEYVTWATDKSGEAFWGHYFDEDLGAAFQDYKTR